MPAIVDRVVIGAKDLDAYLAALPKRVRDRALRRGLYAVARVIRDSARQNAPKRHGFLRRQIVARSGRRRHNHEMVAYVSIDKGRFVRTTTKRGRKTHKKTKENIASIKGKFVNPRRYAHLQEFGTKKHGAQPFLGPAAKEHMGRALQLIADRLIQELTR